MNDCKVLLVDDHPLVREGLRARLSGVAGIEVVGEAGDAAQAFEQVDRLRPDLVLMDVGMKQVNGIELTTRLRERHPTLRVLMLSMYDNPEYVHRALAAGARGYVLKEAPSEEIVAAILAVAEGRNFLGSGLAATAGRPDESRPLLSARETEILRCLADGLASRQIAQTLGMSVRTVETHRHNIRRKLGLAGQAELIKYAVERCRSIGGA
ncbi:response regulator transcription factor [Rhizobacter sp. AJA081-3]|uniref:response regulator transcription factor n=1 Tax=Rhizobacter sp. AJA081-3 TaxID=2753607 RepID=UPI001AE0B759|nr:response regulator transcription factor [Rhizobacter sp. AJA081-3]QTN24885.1 response regulator transcription factor [Rhizobacter sp. AJA081-3]